MVSISIAATTSLLCTDTRQALQNLAQIPLMEGQSRIADEFCPDVIAEWERLEREAQIQDTTLPSTPQSPYLKALLEFKDNCRRRQALERRLRRQQGLSDDLPISIPPPGVPVNDDSLLEGPDFVDPTNQSDFWAADMFTSDQENDRFKEE